MCAELCYAIHLKKQRHLGKHHSTEAVEITGLKHSQVC